MIIDLFVEVLKAIVDWVLSLLPTDFPFIGLTYESFSTIMDTITAFLSPFEQIFPIYMSFMFIGVIISLSITKAVALLVVRILQYLRVLG